MEPSLSIWTIGHSNHDLERFLLLLSDAEIDFVVDVRSYPYSRFASQFDREPLAKALAAARVRYVFMGEELGGRPDREDHFDHEGHALYGEMAAMPAFTSGIARVVEGAGKGRLAIMCSCGKPDECHRRLLVGKVLAERGVELRHILPSGEVRSEREVETPSQTSLLGDAQPQWRSTQSVSHRRRLNTSSAA